MLPAVALVGRPNVGKSTLFNQLTRSRDALVADFPGLTRDRRYGFAEYDDRSFIVVDTGGLGDDSSELAQLAARQTEFAIAETDVIVFVVDYKHGLTTADEQIVAKLRSANKPVILAVNKAEGVAPDVAEAEFHRLGLGAPLSIAALHAKRLNVLLEAIIERLPERDDPSDAHDSEAGPTVAVVGRPNVGKSTLINRLIGSDRMVTSAEPGTTRDSVQVSCERAGQPFVLVDTAGIRRRAKVSETIEKFSIIQSLRAIEEAGVVIVLLDAQEAVTDQDLHLLGLILERGRALAIGVNKWDNLDPAQRRKIEGQIARKLQFVAYAKVTYISALHGSGIDDLLATAFAAYRDAGKTLPTPRLNDILQQAVMAHAPPIVAGRRLRLRYAHQGGRYPPLIVIHGGRAERVPDRYQRYLANAFRQALKLEGTPLRLEFRGGENPFAGRRNVLTRRQLKHRQRVVRHRR